MSQSSVSTKIYSILCNELQQDVPESLSQYSGRTSARTTPDILELVWDKAQNGMLLTDSDGIIVSVNQALCTLTKMSERELVSFPFTVLFDGIVDRKRLFHVYLRMVQNGSIPKKLEQNIVLNSGESIYAEVTNTVITDDAAEQYVFTEIRDISHRKQWELSIRQSEQQYRALFENSVLPMYQSNIDGKLINANLAMLRLLGYDAFDELMKLNLESDVYVKAEDRVKLFEHLQSGGGETFMEVELKKKDGSIITVIPHSRILNDEAGAVSGFEGILEDITERKSLENKLLTNIQKLEITQEELTKLNAQKDKILAIVSHDLRSPFSSILGFCELLKSEFAVLSDPEKLEYIGYINEAAVQQLAMVNSILDWSRLETGRMNLKITPLNLHSVVSTVATSMLGLAKKKEVKIISSIPEGTVLHADEQLIRQLLLNLIGNALKFTPAGGTISIDLSSETAGQTVLMVSDTGVGIPPEDIAKLFKIDEKYTRLGLHGENGTGLGLPMCHEIMKKHNGTIEAVSEEGKGTTFILSFTPPVRSACKRVMIVDDQAGNRLIVSRFMKRISEGSEMVFAETAMDALAQIAENMPDLIITDYHMPQMNGMEFIRLVRSDERMRNIPVIMLSGANLDDQLQSDAVTRILRKPINYNELKGIMDEIRF